MIYNYIKLAWRVLGRKKFFTAISLFGISFTLAILMLITSFLETELGNNRPFDKGDRIVMLNRIKMENMQPDTSLVIDSVLIEGVYVPDTIKTIENTSRSTTISSLSVRFLEEYLSNLDNASNHSIIASDFSFNSYVNNSKVKLDLSYTDANYWDVLNYEFISGKPYDQQMVNNENQVAVITGKLAKEYFGQVDGVLDREIEMDGKNYKVIGVVKRPTSSIIQSDIFTPITLMSRYPGPVDEYTGPAKMLFLADSKNKVDALKAEIKSQADIIPLDVITDYNTLELTGKSMLEEYASFLDYDNPEKAKRLFILILISFLSLFVLLPTLNLINLNVSRILERSSEIGVRRSFGAKKTDILIQFVFENILLTILGGIIGLVFALISIKLINSGGLLQTVQLTINWKFFLYSVVIILFFGVISGILPAYKMSKLKIVNALKENQL